jgi:hypothetical protein
LKRRRLRDIPKNHGRALRASELEYVAHEARAAGHINRVFQQNPARVLCKLHNVMTPIVHATRTRWRLGCGCVRVHQEEMPKHPYRSSYEDDQEPANN